MRAGRVAPGAQQLVSGDFPRGRAGEAVGERAADIDPKAPGNWAVRGWHRGLIKSGIYEECRERVLKARQKRAAGESRVVTCQGDVFVRSLVRPHLPPAGND